MLNVEYLAKLHIPYNLSRRLQISLLIVYSEFVLLLLMDLLILFYSVLLLRSNVMGMKIARY